MANFDSAMRESCTVRESRTNTPLQALNLMNDVTFVEAARRLAERVLREAQPPERADLLFRLVLARKPTPSEQQKIANAAAFYRDQFSSHPEKAASFLTFGDSKPDPALSPAELAAWTAVSSAMFNLDEAVTKE